MAHAFIELNRAPAHPVFLPPPSAITDADSLLFKAYSLVQEIQPPLYGLSYMLAVKRKFAQLEEAHIRSLQDDQFEYVVEEIAPARKVATPSRQGMKHVMKHTKKTSKK